MPTYDYRCDSCGKTAERVMSVSEMEKADVACPDCELSMRRDYVREHGGALAFESRQKGRFPFICHDLYPEPTKVYDMQQLQDRMREKQVVPLESTDDAKARARDMKRRFY